VRLALEQLVIKSKSIKNDEKINVQIFMKPFFDKRDRKRSLSEAKTSVFNQVDRKISR